MRQDVRQASRVLRSSHGWITAAILALGIGATTAIFTVVKRVLVDPLPYHDSDALVRIVHSIGGIDQPYFSDAIYLTYVDNTQAFQDLGVWIPGDTATITGLGEPEEVRTFTASRGVLTTLGVEPEVGRWFSTADDTPGAPDTVMLAHGYWQRRLGGDAGVLERSLTINNRPHQIVGVMPAGFRFGGGAEILLPLRVDRAAPVSGFRLLGVARLKPGVTLTQANADVVRVLHVWFEVSGASPAVRARWASALTPLKQDVVGDIGRVLWVLMGALVLVLLMACANVATLLLVQADGRRRELAIRAAMGASWTRIARQLLVESLALALLGGALGVVVAHGGLRALVAIRPANLPRLDEISIDPAALGFALTVSLVSGLLFGLVPILKHARPRAATPGLGSRGAGLTPERQRSQQALVVGQVALALVLLVSAGLMIRSFQALRRVDPGFVRPDRVLTFSISLPVGVVAEPDRVVRLQHDLLDRIAAIPGVVSAAYTTRVPMGSDRSSAALSVEDQPDNARTPPNRQIKIVSPGLFRTLGTPLAAGRDFAWTDLHGMRDVAIVSENLARELWGTPAAALGRRVREYYNKESRWREIVGVAGDVRDDGADQPPPATIFWPAQPDEYLLSMSAGYQARRVSVAIRSERADTASLLGEVRDAVRSVNSMLPLSQVRTLDEVYGQSLARTSFTVLMLAIAGTMALALGLSGVYGVIAYAVSRRRREIGIRVALGAQPREIRRLFVRRGLAVVGAGLALGLGGALAATRSIQALLFGVSPLDPLTFAAMPLALAGTALLAGYLPARRALAIDPVETLRAE